jgi:hypothetical protein
MVAGPIKVRGEKMDLKKEKGDVRIVKMGAWSGGPGCHGGCGVEVYIRDGRVINVNQLIPMGYQSRSGFGGGPYKSMLCKLYKV